MQNACLKIDNIKIISTHIEIDRNCRDKFNLNVECRGRVGKPKNETDTKLLLNVALDICSTEPKDLNIQLEADVYFSYKEQPADFDVMVEKECMPMAQKLVFDKVDKILVELGYGELNLAENI